MKWKFQFVVGNENDDGGFGSLVELAEGKLHYRAFIDPMLLSLSQS
jgi:hypothetical protein